MTIYKIVNSGGDGNLTFNSEVVSSSLGNALEIDDAVASSFTVDLDAFLYSNFDNVTPADAVVLGGGGAWTVTINGFVGSDSRRGLYLPDAPTILTALHKVTVGVSGALGGETHGLQFDSATTVTNSGLIAGGDDGIFANASGTYTITNKAGAVIGGDENGIRFIGLGTHTVSNAGLIAGGVEAILGGDGIEKITNLSTGVIQGLISLGGGNDTFTNSGKVDFTTIDMGGGNDVFTGGAIAEKVTDGAGIDKFVLGAGNDYFIATSGSSADVDTIDGGTGIDTYDATAQTDGVDDFFVINLDGVAHGNDAATGFVYGISYALKTAGTDDGVNPFVKFDIVSNFESVLGSQFEDIIFGSAVANTLHGNGSFDDLWGLAGNDALYGGDGADNLFGGAGKDDLWGGDGSVLDGADDAFQFLLRTDSGLTLATRDVIHDFEQGIDQISLQFDSNLVISGEQEFTASNFIGLSAFRGGVDGRGDLRYVYAGNQTIIQADLNGDMKADFSLALEGLFVLTADDFGL
jgi:hypothetical protein